MGSDHSKRLSARRIAWRVPILLSFFAIVALYVGLHPLAGLGSADYHWQSLIPSVVGVGLAAVLFTSGGRFSCVASSGVNPEAL